MIKFTNVGHYFTVLIIIVIRGNICARFEKNTLTMETGDEKTYRQNDKFSRGCLEILNRKVRSEPEPNYERKDGSVEKFKPVAEPNPQFETAIPIMGAAWPIHVCVSFALYLLVFVATVLILIDLSRTWKERSKTLTVCLATCLLIFSSFRIIVLLVDPYNSRRLITHLMWRILWVVPFPACTTAFCVVLIVLMDTTKMTVGPPRFQRVSFVLVVAFVHLAIVLGAEVIVYFVDDTMTILFVCQIITFVWGGFLVVGYALVGLKIHRNLRASIDVNLHKTSDSENKKIFNLRRYIFLSSCTGMAFCITGLYGAIGVYGLMGTGEVEPWPWWVYQSFTRVIESAMCALTIALAMRTSLVNALAPLQNLRARFNKPLGKVSAVDDQVEITKTSKEDEKSFATKTSFALMDIVLKTVQPCAQ